MFRTTGFCLKTVSRTNFQKSIARNLKISSCLSTVSEDYKKAEYSNFSQKRYQLPKYLIGAFSILGLGYYSYKNSAFCEEKPHGHPHEKTSFEWGKIIDDLPFYSEEEVKQHKTKEKGIWVSYRNGVYDITEFVDGHPGGNKIMWGAGHSLEPFWEKFPIHYKHEVFELLEEYRIGNLKIDESKKKPVEDKIDFYKDEPTRNSRLKVLSQKPFNAESPKDISAENLVTPSELHFIRNHMPVPKIEPKSFKLSVINSNNAKKIEFSLEDLETKFESITIPVTIQCSGNRRKYMNAEGSVQGLQWDANAISTALWTGVRLRDVLIYCGFDLNDPKIRHVIFEGLDKDPAGSVYSASIPIEKVKDENGEVLLAYRMNDQPIPLDNGYPLRALVPGIIGARSVKWLGKVVLSEDESQSFWQLNDYKVLPPNVKNLKEADFSKLRAIQESPITSAICQPTEETIIKRNKGKFTAKGYAFSGGGNEVLNVLVSIDNGKNWKQAVLHKFDRPLYKSWAWALWEIELDIPEGQDNIEIVCTATDSNQNTQPENIKAIWNARGLLNNAWHRVKVNIE